MFNEIRERIDSLSGRNPFTATEVQPSQLSKSRKTIGALALKCAAAHWYLLPGLEFQRHALALAVSTLGCQDRSRVKLVDTLNTLPPTFYLEAAFALECLRDQSHIGSYLDFSSPSLLPLYLLKTFIPDRAVLMSIDNVWGVSRQRLKHLAKVTRISEPTCASMADALHELQSFEGTFDTITCLGTALAVSKQRILIQTLWNALKPGGTLILSRATTPAASRNPPALPLHRLGRLNSDSISDPLANLDLISALGRPRRYAIYGEDERLRCPSGAKRLARSSWRKVSVLARQWRRYASLNQIQSRGLIALKFSKP